MSRRALNKGAMPIAIPNHWYNSGIFHGASPRCFPYTTVRQLTQPVVGYTARDMALEFGPPSGTGKLIPLLLDAGTSSCTSCLPASRWNFPTATQVLQHRCDQWASTGAGIVRQDSPRASQPQAILKLRPPSSLDYKARHGPQTITISMAKHSHKEFLRL